MSASNPLARILESNRLVGLNYKDWFRNLKIVLNSEKLGYVLDQEPPILPDHPTARQTAANEKWMEDDTKVKCYVLASMSNELQSQHEDMPTARAIIAHLQELYREQSRTARFEVSKRLFGTKMREGQAVHDHCLTMIKDIEQLEKLGIPIHRELQVDLILQSLPSSFGQFVMNYHMNKLNYTLPELLNQLVSNEGTLKSSRVSVLSVEQTSSFKRKSQKKKKFAKKQKNMKPKKKDGPKKAIVSKGKCFHCNNDGHWKRNCPIYLESLKTKKAEKPSEGMFVIESNLTVSSTSSWVLDSGSSTHICTSLQGLVESRRLRDGEIILRVANGAKVAAAAVGVYPLRLPCGFRLILKDCYYVPGASRNLISISVLSQDGFSFEFNKDFCNIYLRNEYVARGLLINNLYHLHDDASVNVNEQIVNTLSDLEMT